MNPLYLGLEIAVAAFFAAAAWAALRRGRLPFLELVSAAAFGLLLEEGDQLIFETYEYSPQFVLAIDRAPVVIGLTWALILAGAMRITDALGVRRRYAPFVDSILAIMLDLAFDAVAIRMGLWTWRDVGPENGWFGVPAGNFYAWLFVTAAFSFMSRWLRARADRSPGPTSPIDWLQVAVPVPSFVLLLLALLPFTLAKPMVDPSPGGGLWLFAVTLAAFGALATLGIWESDRQTTVSGRQRGERHAILDLRLAFATRLAIHLFFLGALLVLELHVRAPVLLIVSVALLLAELPLAWLVRHRLKAMGPADASPSVVAALAPRVRQ